MATIAQQKKRGLSLNMGIAFTNQVANQFVGIQLSGANVLAQAVSALSVVAGTVSIAAINYPGAWPLLIMASVIGLGLAVLIEGLTLGALIRVRLSGKLIKELDANLIKTRDEQLALVKRPAPQLDIKAYKAEIKAYRLACSFIEQDYRRKRNNALREHKRNRWSSAMIATFGASASACAGGLFYHTILESIGVWQSMALSALFALAVTGTFVSSELFKDIQEQAIREGFAGGALTDAAMREETKRLSAQAVHDGILEHMQSEEAQNKLKEAALSLLIGIISELHRSSEKQTEQKNVSELATPSDDVVSTKSSEMSSLSEQEVDTFVESNVDTEEVQEVDTEEDGEVDTDEHPVVDIVTYRNEQGTVSTQSSKVTRKLSTKVSTSTRHGGAQQKALRILKKNPGIGPTELAERAQISRSYASRILAQVVAK